MKIFVNVKQIGKKRNAVTKVEYEILKEIYTVKQFIEEIVKIEVEKFNNKVEEKNLIDYLTSDEIRNYTNIGKVSFGDTFNKNKQNIEQALENALQSYVDGIYRIFLNSDEVGDLDSKIIIKEQDEFTFVRLTMLAGRIW